MRTNLYCLLILGALAAPTRADRVSYPPEEFIERRAKVCEAIEDEAVVILFSKTKADVGVRFRQDHDFFYLTGNENSNGAVVIDAESCDAWLFPFTIR